MLKYADFVKGLRVRDVSSAKRGAGTVKHTQTAYGNAPASYVVWVNWDSGLSQGAYPQELEPEG